jgi:hypothetical protein
MRHLLADCNLFGHNRGGEGRTAPSPPHGSKRGALCNNQWIVVSGLTESARGIERLASLLNR